MSSNHIAGIEEPIFSHLNNLLYLDLSHNTHVQFVDDGRSFSSIQNNLVYLGLRNTSLINVSKKLKEFFNMVELNYYVLSLFFLFLIGTILTFP